MFTLLLPDLTFVSFQMLSWCGPSVAILEVMLNSYTSIPPCDWMDRLSAEACEVSRPHTSDQKKHLELMRRHSTNRQISKMD